MSCSFPRGRFASLPLVITGILGVTASASSQPSALAPVEHAPEEHAPAEPTPADAAFARGRSLVDGGDMAGACEAFTESYRLEPALGTLLNLAWCHEQTNKRALALAEYARARSQAEEAGQSRRARFAARRIEALHAVVPRILVEVAHADRRAIVSLDGVPVDPATLREPIPLDPGEHQLAVQAEGRRAFHRQLQLASKGGIVRSLVPNLDGPSAPAPSAREAPVVETGSRALGFVVGGAGVLALGAGTYFGIRTFSLKSDANGHCEGRYCDDIGLELSSDAQRAATLSTLSFVAGGAAVAAGTWLVVRKYGVPQARLRARAGMGPAGGYMSVGGEF